ncbi:hypothetical protein LDJ89_01640 [Fusobacterium nucleatum]|uniref:hypothetical protein n=1 Tax=Fusobacterium nucleatum TaxID=851 RepID=UPI001EED508D|nr:hypothetical protein [Fusobacterium nucleatum]MCG6842213.1 hypothetical protein [Fusobacterium nucleatum]
MIENLSYFGFKKFDTAYQARDGFQIKYDYYNQNDPYHSWSNAAVRGILIHYNYMIIQQAS